MPHTNVQHNQQHNLWKTRAIISFIALARAGDRCGHNHSSSEKCVMWNHHRPPQTREDSAMMAMRAMMKTIPMPNVRQHRGQHIQGPLESLYSMPFSVGVPQRKPAAILSAHVDIRRPAIRQLFHSICVNGCDIYSTPVVWCVFSGLCTFSSRGAFLRTAVCAIRCLWPASNARARDSARIYVRIFVFGT